MHMPCTCLLLVVHVHVHVNCACACVHNAHVRVRVCVRVRVQVHVARTSPRRLTLRELIYDLGGGIKGGELLAVIPGGSSTPILRPDELVDAPDEKSPIHKWHGKSVLDVPMGVDTMRGLGTMLGTCCAIVLSDKACPVLAMHNLMRFYRHESCGQCTPCREGSGWIERILDSIVAGEAQMDDLDRLHEIAGNIMGNTICAFGEGTAMPALGFLRKFRPHFEEYVKTGGQSSTGKLAL